MSQQSAAQQDVPAPSPDPVPNTRIPIKFEDWLSVCTISLLAIITFANVLVRYLTSGSFAWTEEMSVFLLIILTMVGTSSAFVRRQHIAIEFIAKGGSTARQKRLSVISTITVLAFFILLTILSIHLVMDDFKWGGTTPAIGIPSWWYSVWLPVFGILIVLRIAGVLARLIREVS